MNNLFNFGTVSYMFGYLNNGGLKDITGAAIPSIYDSKYVEYLSLHNKGYGTNEEFMLRQKLYMEMDVKINQWNANPKATHKLGHNRFSDWTDFERKKLTGFVGTNKAKNEVILDTSEIPESVNWVEQGAVAPVQNQGMCGSCWAFSAIGAMEGAHFIKTGKLLKLSEQQCVDCVKDANGCNGGWQEDCFEYAMGDEMNTEA
jgi:C1A family cysteine protease